MRSHASRKSAAAKASHLTALFPRSGGRMWARAFIDVTVVAGSIQVSKDGKVIGVHPIRYDRSCEFGAFVNSQGRARSPDRLCRLAITTQVSPRAPELDRSRSC